MARWLLGAALVGLVAACDGTESTGSAVGDPDAGLVEPDAGSQGGEEDAGVPDAALSPDAGAGPDANIPEPSVQGWTFYGTSQGGPSQVRGVTADEGGNVWVAGGAQGLYLLRPGSRTFERFTQGDGLYAVGTFEVISVSGGPAGTVFVGYQGWDPPGDYGCEDEWDRPDGIDPAPSVYKSGDADRVTLSGGGIQVQHYDISSPTGFVAAEPRGREKLCTVYRILYDAHSQSVWFGGNHAYAWGDPASARVMEHAHPLLNGFVSETIDHEYALTGGYYGLAVEPTGDLWVGGIYRSQRCPAGLKGSGFWDCESQGSLSSGEYALDWWPDLVHVDSRPRQRTDDRVSGLARGLDGSLWIGSFVNGLARRLPDGEVELITAGLVDPNRVSSVAVDPSDGSVWVGATRGGLTRIHGTVLKAWDGSVLGGRASSEITDIQVDRSGTSRRILVAFRNGSIGIYEGP
ncbi:MAG: hypothetical protein HY901_00360 [Deltaproteobacteria bacterium]|nr:hypothetical protein [Deltaproteobacteria bacterium]